MGLLYTTEDTELQDWYSVLYTNFHKKLSASSHICMASLAEKVIIIMCEQLRFESACTMCSLLRIFAVRLDVL